MQRKHRLIFFQGLKDHRPADLLLFNWIYDEDICLDIIGVFPFASTCVSFWAHSAFLAHAG